MRLLLEIGFFVGLLVAVTCENNRLCTSELDGHLLVAERGTIWKTNSEGKNRTALANYTSHSLSLDYDIVKNVVFWCNSQTQEVHYLKEDRSNASKIAIPKQNNWLPIGIAVDPLSGKIYVAEGFSDTVQIFDLENDDANNKAYVVVGTNVSELRKIVLDPYRGYLFVLDRYQIFRTDLDGENHQAIYSEIGNMYDIVSELPTFFRNILDYSIQRNPSDSRNYKKSISVADIALDLEERRIYWVNTLKQRIESSNYDGKDMKTHFEERNVFKLDETSASITLIDEYLYWANDISEKVVKVDVNNATNNKVILKSVKTHAIKGISCSAHRAIKNPCAEAKCQQLCVRSNSGDKKFRCACELGYELTDDGSTCRPVQEFLLYTQNQYVRGRLLDVAKNGFVDVLNPTKFEVGSKTDLDYDSSDNLLFYASLYPKNKLHQIQLDSGEGTIIQPDFLSKDVGQFAYDWSTRNIYYFAHYYADATMLSLTNVRNSTFSKIILNHAEGLIRDMVVYPKKGYLFFASLFDEDNRGTITRIGMDGSKPQVIMTSGTLDTLDGLAIDYQENRIYWSQSQRTSNGVWKVSIRHSDLNGGNVEELSLPENLGRPDSLAISGNSLYVIENGEKLIKLNKRSGNEIVNLVNSELPGLLSGLRFFNLTFQDDNHRPCESLDCEKLCILAPDSKSGLSRAKCACPYGEKLDFDGRSCVDNRDEEPAFVPCEFESFKCNKRTVDVQ